MTERKMFYGASPTLFEQAKRLRENMTYHEKLLWEKIKSNQIHGLRFKAQHPIAIYIVDFYCHKLKLVIEVDGKNHMEKDQAEYDADRSHELHDFGISVIRFSNQEIEQNIEKVITEISNLCLNLLRHISSE
ncbi:hypothetical protein AWW68_18060 [Roseivirga spongicola]|uniref:DUF559 domain-containing protein n=1 Tax=Roseivirga spongicola TaxID=333140 RepID=A0A150WZR5_9BACT|nr:endonuclease domain-containing protein [Roseivirga spongicola]KYG71916.1 hypothetical protein AWW68_18060 [Roseivirga spongicola]